MQYFTPKLLKSTTGGYLDVVTLEGEVIREAKRDESRRLIEEIEGEAGS